MSSNRRISIVDSFVPQRSLAGPGLVGCDNVSHQVLHLHVHRSQNGVEIAHEVTYLVERIFAANSCLMMKPHSNG